MSSLPSDLEISRRAELKPLHEIAETAGIPEHLIETHGPGVAKIDLRAM
jgi:formate--tetrahydrofolate ligase